MKHLFEDTPVVNAGQADVDPSHSPADQSIPVIVHAGNVPERPGAAPSTPREDVPLRNSNSVDDEPDQSGVWDPAADRPGDFASADALDPGVDHFLPSDDEDMALDADMSENKTMDALNN